MQMTGSSTWLRVAALGALAWWVVLRCRPAGPVHLDAIERLLLLHLFCLTPLLLGALRVDASWGSPVFLGALLAAWSGFEPVTGAAAPWVVITAGLLVTRVPRLRLRPLDVPEAAAATALLFLAVGAGWIVVRRAGLVLPGLVPEQILLAAIHAHYTGFAVLTLTAVVAERMRARDPGSERWALPVVIGVGVGFAVTGTGIAFAPMLEPVGAALLALSLLGLASLSLGLWRETHSWSARTLLVVSALALLAGITLGVLYSARHLGLALLVRPQMIQLHGWTVALGFVLCGVAAHLLELHAAGRLQASAAPLLLYDGSCGLCNRSVSLLLRMDRAQVLRFAPLQGETARPILERHGLSSDSDTIVLVYDPGGPGERIALRYTAAVGVLQVLGGGWRPMARAARVVPSWVGDLPYRLVASTRHLWPPPNLCRVPTPEERLRLLP